MAARKTLVLTLAALSISAALAVTDRTSRDPAPVIEPTEAATRGQRRPAADVDHGSNRLALPAVAVGARLIYSTSGTLGQAAAGVAGDRESWSGPLIVHLAGDPRDLDVRCDATGLRFETTRPPESGKTADRTRQMRLRLRWRRTDERQGLRPVGDVQPRLLAVVDAVLGGLARAGDVEGRDGVGAFRARVAEGRAGETRTAERHKLAYESGVAADRLQAAPGGSARYEFRGDAIWPSRVDVDECCDVGFDGGPAHVYRCRARAVLLRASRSDPAREVARPSPAVRPIDDWIAALDRGLEAGGLRDEATQQAWRGLIDAIADNPELAASVAERVRGEGRAGTRAFLLLNALGAAGHAAAQQALLEVFGDETLETRVREASAVAMVQVVEPTVATLDALRRTVGRSAEASDHATAGLLAWGTLAGRAADADGAVRRLLAFEQRARTTRTTVPWLEALGNSAHPVARETVAAYLSSPEAHERIAAAFASRAHRDSRSTAVVAERLAMESNAEVRRELVASLAGRTDSRALTALREATRDASAGVRRDALLALSGIAAPQRRNLLQRAAAGDPSPKIREPRGACWRAADQPAGDGSAEPRDRIGLAAATLPDSDAYTRFPPGRRKWASRFAEVRRCPGSGTAFDADDRGLFGRVRTGR